MNEAMAVLREPPGRTPSPIDFALVDESGHAFLLIDDGDEPGAHRLILRITNRSDRNLTWLPPPDGAGTPSMQFHHLRVSFPPGLLSKNAREMLKDQQQLLGADAEHWQAALSEGQSGLLSLLLVYTEIGRAHV